MIPTRSELRALVGRFYEGVRADERLGPIFAAHVTDWDDHIERLTDFWSSLLLGSGAYSGNPLAAHVPFAQDLDAALFARWLDLWRAATDDLLAPELAAGAQIRAERIAEVFKGRLLADRRGP